MGIAPAQLAARYRGFATQCLIVAQRQESAGDKLALVNMAQTWIALAEQTVAVCETADDIDDKDGDSTI